MSRPVLNEACTKIVATVGPACQEVDQLAELIEAGVDVFRINGAHGTREQHDQVLANIRLASKRVGFAAGVLLDLSGPKIRLGSLQTEPRVCVLGEAYTFIRGEESADESELTSNYPRLIDELSVGDQVMLADGTVTMVVQDVADDRVTCVVTAGGEIRSRQGINLPGVNLSVAAMRPEDISNAIWGAENGLDFISLSFVRTASDVQSLKDLLRSHEASALVIAKIEKPEALDELDAIVDAADGVMVARGDLGVEIDVAEMPVAQKRIIDKCREKLKPVIVATQMLDSMHHSRRPTRAEATDVANAVLDGADACMLSGETAIGDFPVDAVKMMNRIMKATESGLLGYEWINERQTGRVHPVTTAVTRAATNVAEGIEARLLVIATRSGNTAWVKSNCRSLIPTLGASDSEATLRRMNLFWGIKPLRISSMSASADLIREILKWSDSRSNLHAGDQVVFVTGTGVMDGAHNVVIVHTVEA